MSKEILSILNNEKLLLLRDNHFARMKKLHDKSYDSPAAFVQMGINGARPAVLGDNPKSKVEEALDELTRHAKLLEDKIVFRPLCVEFDIYGVHFPDKIFNAEVFQVDGSWQVKTLDSSIGSLQKPDLDNCPTWILARELAKEFVNANVKLPLFGTPTISSALNVAVNLYGQEILLSMMIDPAGTEHDLKIINDTLCEIHKWYITNVPADQLQPVVSWERTQPPGFGQLCGCTTQLVSPDMYKKFVAPLDEEILSLYPNGGMIHLCGSHTQHIPVWREMKNLHALQLNDAAAEDLEIYFKEMREDQIFYINTCPGMTTEKIMKITGGNRVVIVTPEVKPDAIKLQEYSGYK